MRLEQQARVAWKVVLYCSNRASVCSHALILLSQTRWIVMTGWHKHQSTARVQTHLDCGSLLHTSISFRPVFQTYLYGGSLSAHTHQYPALCSNTFLITVLVVYMHRLHLVFQTRSECGSLSAYMHQFPALCFIHVWVIDSVSGYKHLPLLPWSNTFGFWSPSVSQTRFDHGSLSAYASVFNPVFLMCLDCESLSVHTHPSPALFKHV